MKLCLTSQIKKWVYDLWETRNSIKTKKSQKQRSNGYRQITSPSKAILLKRRSRGCKTNEATFALSCLWSHCFRTNEQKFQIKKNPCERVQETLRRPEDVRRKYFSDWQSVISRVWACVGRRFLVNMFLVKMFLGRMGSWFGGNNNINQIRSVCGLGQYGKS